MKTDRKSESGQAIVEMMIGMIGMMCVFLGVIFICTVGLQTFLTVIASRTVAERNVINGTGGGAGSEIMEWNVGSDGLSFTKDDKFSTGVYENVGHFTGQLVSPYSSQTFSVAESVKFGEYTVSSPFASLSSDSLFLTASDLTAGTSSNSNPFSAAGLDGMDKTLKRFLGIRSTFTISSSAYMPIAAGEKNTQ